MDRPLVAIVGSPWLRDPKTGTQIIDAARATHHKAARAACVELGAALARAGCRLLVYSAEPRSIEPEAVMGYVGESRERRAIAFRILEDKAASFQSSS